MNEQTTVSNEQSAVSGPRPVVRRGDFIHDETAHHYLLAARQWQHAWAMAVFHRCPLAYRAFLRRRMREDALFAVRLMRNSIALRAPSLAA